MLRRVPYIWDSLHTLRSLTLIDFIQTAARNQIYLTSEERNKYRLPQTVDRGCFDAGVCSSWIKVHRINALDYFATRLTFIIWLHSYIYVP
jgi:hypothetical protein